MRFWLDEIREFRRQGDLLGAGLAVFVLFYLWVATVVVVVCAALLVFAEPVVLVHIVVLAGAVWVVWRVTAPGGEQ